MCLLVTCMPSLEKCLFDALPIFPPGRLDFFDIGLYEFFGIY